MAPQASSDHAGSTQVPVIETAVTMLPSKDIGGINDTA